MGREASGRAAYRRARCKPGRMVDNPVWTFAMLATFGTISIAATVRKPTCQAVLCDTAKPFSTVT
eukprot:1160080-Pelagomonas_calceolata.AAC.3